VGGGVVHSRKRRSRWRKVSRRHILRLGGKGGREERFYLSPEKKGMAVESSGSEKGWSIRCPYPLRKGKGRRGTSCLVEGGDCPSIMRKEHRPHKKGHLCYLPVLGEG